MIGKTLHAGNIAVAFATAATAVDLTLTGGVGTAITVALSGLEVFRTSDKATKSRATDMAKQIEDHLNGSHLTDNRKKIVVQMLAKFAPVDADLIAASMDADTVAQNMRTRITDMAPDIDRAYTHDVALDDYTAILAATLAPYLEPEDLTGRILQELLKQSNQSGQSNRLRDEGITENAIIRLAQRVATGTDDLGQAWLELQNAMDIAVRVQQEGHIASNHGDFVDVVLKRVAEHAADGDYAAASAEIIAALAEEDAAHQARKARLLDSGTEIAMLEGDSSRAAALLVQKADLDADGQAGFGELRKLWQGFYEKGRDKGTALDATIAIDIANLVLTRATSPDERGNALNDLGTALSTLGERDSSTARLEQAVAAYEAALQEWTRARVPLQWATTQMNLGTALSTLGERDSGTARLEQAVAAYENALLEWTREKVPLDWAMTQHCLSSLELAFHAKANDAAHLGRAMAHARAAQEEYVAAGAEYYITWIANQIAKIDAAGGG